MRNRKIFAILTLVAFMMTLLPMAAFAAEYDNNSIDRNTSILTLEDESVEADGDDEAEFTVYLRTSSNRAVYGDTVRFFVASERASTDLIYPELNSSDEAKYTAIYFENDDFENVDNIIENVVDDIADGGYSNDNDYDDPNNGIYVVAAGDPVYVNDDYLDDDDSEKLLSSKLADSGITHPVVAILVNNSSGQGVFEVVSNASGDADIAVGTVWEDDDEDGLITPYEYLTDSDIGHVDANIIKGESRTVTFEATDSSDVVVTNIENRDGDSVDIPSESGDEGDREYGSESNGAVPDVAGGDDAVKANGTDYFEVTFAVRNASNAPVEDETIEFSSNKNSVRFNVDEKETDEIGEAEVKVYADEAGTYKIEGTVGSDSATIWLTFAPAEVSDIELTGDVDELIAIDENAPDSFKFELSDANGNKIDPRTVDLIDEAGLEFEWLTEPDDSDLDDDWATSGIDEIGEESDYLTFTEDNLIEVDLPKLDEEGTYVVRVNIDNGKYIDVEFEGREQGDITELTLEYDTVSMALGSISDPPTVKRYDADGVGVKVANNSSDLTFSINDFRGLEEESVTAIHGQLDEDADEDPEDPKDAVYTDPRDLDETDGTLCITTDDDYIGEYTVTVIDTKEDLTASFDIVVGNDVIGLDVDAADELVVGEDNVITLKLKDADGNTIGLGDDVNNIEFDTYVVKQPEGAYASADATDSDSKLEKDLRQKGQGSVDVYSKAAGEVTFAFVVTVDYSSTSKSDINLTKNVTLTFGEPKSDVVIGAKNVTLFIGSTGYVADGVAKTADQAPFIQDGRTFVPVRMVGEALGAEVEYDAATQVITLTREDLTVTMTVGSNVLTKSDGTTVVADVAPFIVPETGRTVIPFRAIAEAFGADVEAVFAADGTVNAVTFAQ
ncbi:MAG: stalk domain-containing protein [Peptococcaceae bacterium]